MIRISFLHIMICITILYVLCICLLIHFFWSQNPVQFLKSYHFQSFWEDLLWNYWHLRSCLLKCNILFSILLQWHLQKLLQNKWVICNRNTLPPIWLISNFACQKQKEFNFSVIVMNETTCVWIDHKCTLLLVITLCKYM